MAAGRELQGTKSRGILSQLIDRVGELSDAWMHRNTATTKSGQEGSKMKIQKRRSDVFSEDPQIAIPVQVLPPLQLLCSVDRLPQCHKAKIQSLCIQ